MVKIGQNLSHWFYIYANNLKNLQNSDLILGIQLNLALIKLYPWKKKSLASTILMLQEWIYSLHFDKVHYVLANNFKKLHNTDLISGMYIGNI